MKFAACLTCNRQQRLLRPRVFWCARGRDAGKRATCKRRCQRERWQANAEAAAAQHPHQHTQQRKQRKNGVTRMVVSHVKKRQQRAACVCATLPRPFDMCTHVTVHVIFFAGRPDVTLCMRHLIGDARCAKMLHACWLCCGSCCASDCSCDVHSLDCRCYWQQGSCTLAN